MTDQLDIGGLRAELDSIDREIASLVDRRMAVTEQIGALKAKNGAPLFDASREAEILETARSQVVERNGDIVASVMESLLSASRERQRTIISPEATPRTYFRNDFHVGISELDSEGRVRPSSLCNWFQETATIHAANLGMGMPLINGTTHSWMLSRVTLEFYSWPKWNDHVIAHTWPSGMKNRLIALRDFTLHDDKENLLAAGKNEYLYIDVSNGRITRLPPEFAEFAPPGTPRSPVADEPAPDPREALGEGTRHSIDLEVLNAFADVNRHANHIHFIDWILEPLPATVRPKRMDIVFRQGAKPGTKVRSEAVVGADGEIRSRISLTSDDTTLAVALTRQ